MLQQLTKKSYLYIALITVAAFSAVLFLRPQKVEAACAPVDTSRGTVTSNFTVTQAGTYTVWSRVMGNGTNDSYTLEIDGTTCNVTVGNLNNSASGWQWVNYRDGNTNSKITVNLTAGTHSMTMIGKEDGVKVDRVLFLSGDACTPTGTGDNCANQDMQPPTNVAISSPANNATINGVTPIQATAIDNTGVTKMEFYMGTTLLGTDNAAPFAFSLNTALYPPGNYKLTARAFDAAGNNATSAQVSVTIPPPPDTTPPTVTITGPLNNSTVSGTININALPQDNIGVTKLEVLINGAVRTTINSSPYSYPFDTKSLADGTHTISVRAYDAAGLTATASVTVIVKNTVTPPSKQCDFNGSGVVDLTDLSILLSRYGQTVEVNKNGDCNGDGAVALTDLSILLSKYGL